MARIGVYAWTDCSYLMTQRPACLSRLRASQVTAKVQPLLNFYFYYSVIDLTAMATTPKEYLMDYELLP